MATFSSHMIVTANLTDGAVTGAKLGVGSACLEPFKITTDANGEVDVTLDYTPADVNSVACFMVDELRRAECTGLAAKVASIRVYKIGTAYEECSTINAATIPVSVSVQAAKTSVDTGGGGSNIDPSATGAGGGSLTGSIAHQHGVSHIYEHAHTLTTTALADDNTKNRAASEVDLQLIVMYSK